LEELLWWSVIVAWPSVVFVMYTWADCCVAIGFKRRMVQGSFLLESSFVAILGTFSKRWSSRFGTCSTYGAVAYSLQEEKCSTQNITSYADVVLPHKMAGSAMR